MKLSGSLLRVSLLLFVVSAVGLIGLNGSLDPTRVQTARAAALDIVLSSNGAGSLQFQLNLSDECYEFLAPGDSCFANVVVENAGDETAEISPPTADVEGVLHTCTGNDPDNPGSGGSNIDVFFDNESYDFDDPVTLLDPGDTEDFDVVFELDAGIGNACQGKSATIIVTILIGLAPEDEEDDDDDTPPATATPIVFGPVFIPTSTPVAQVSAVVVTPTLTAEVLPTRLPVTGHGWTGETTLSPAGFFWGLGALGLLSLTLAILLRRPGARR